MTVNDYLARRDMEWMGPLYLGLGLTVGAIQANMDSDERKASYDGDITYGTNNEFGFDYLRDNMKPAKEIQVQRPLNFAIVDEIDNILIDEARTPLIISGFAHDDTSKYPKADRIARQLQKGRALRGQGKGAYLQSDRRRRARGGEAGRRGKLLHRRQHGMAAPDRQLPEGASPLQARRELRRRTGAGDHRRRIHRPKNGGPAMERRSAPGRRSQRRA